MTDWKAYYYEHPHERNRFCEFKSACKDAIWEQLLDFQKKQFKKSAYLQCSITKELVNFEEAKVDHVPEHPIDGIIKSWIKENNALSSSLEWEKIQLYKIYVTVKGTTFPQWKFKDAKVKDDFSEFHKKHAHLHIIKKPPDENGRKKRKKDKDNKNKGNDYSSKTENNICRKKRKIEKKYE